jgi:hypothetical protein
MTICSKCGAEHARNGRYCLGCHAAYMREWRKTHPMSDEERFKDSARSYAGVYKRRGKLVPQPCQCGAPIVEMHHPDYAKPLEVEWTCRPCHLEIHRTPIYALPAHQGINTHPPI